MTTHTKETIPADRFTRIGLILLLALPLMLTGCGQKGDLYLPDQASSHTSQQA